MLEDAWAGRILFLGDMRPCRRKPFFLGDMMLQRENRNGNRFCNAWRLGSTIPFFFFLAASIPPCPTGHFWPSGQMAAGKKRLAFFFFGSLANVLPSVCKRKKKQK